jgi:5-methylcytosine-specific restriction endonuclease McrA
MSNAGDIVDWKARYNESLADPQWKAVRWRILIRDHYTCQACNRRFSYRVRYRLNVHHIHYAPGEPWETPDKWLVTLCDACHKEETERPGWFQPKKAG